MALYNTEAIVIRVRDFDEADKIVVLLSRDEGKIQAVAKGARRPRNRYAAAAQIFTHVKAALYSGRSLDTLSQIDIEEPFRHLREDLVRMAYGTYACELMDEMVRDHQKVEAGYLLLLATLHLLNEETYEPEPIIRAYELKLLSILGFRPSLAECVSCGGDTDGEGPVRFSPALGGVLCPHCSGEGEAVHRLNRGTLETMKRLLEGDLRRVHMIRISREMAMEMDRVLSDYIGQRLERKLRSKDFLDSLR
ncbi:MAG: DNA repair protein RecO [Mycobacterium leprae]